MYTRMIFNVLNYELELLNIFIDFPINHFIIELSKGSNKLFMIFF